MTREQLQAIMDKPGFGTGRAFLDQAAQEAEALALLPTPERVAPVRATTDPGTGWLVCSFGNSGEDGKDWHVITDEVRASELAETFFPEDAKLDAHRVAAILNLYRMGVLTTRSMIGVKRLVWKDESRPNFYPSRMVAPMPCGTGDYSITGSAKRDAWQWYLNGNRPPERSSAERRARDPYTEADAKAACQAHYEARIRRALEEE